MVLGIKFYNMKNLVQIGTNVANDDFTKIVREFGNENINQLILVEPIESCNPNIHSCYEGFKYILENMVINVDDSKTTETFYISKYNWLSSLNESHIEKHKTGEIPVKVSVNAMTLNNLFKKHNLKNIDILFIDSEGMDDKLVKSIDFDLYEIGTIYYEHSHIDNESFIGFLNQKNYDVNVSDFSDGLTSVAVKRTDNLKK
jgi:hypothetical protein